MLKIIRIINCFLSIILSCLLISEDHSQVNSSGDWKGYAVYRGGVITATCEYHAGLMYGTTRTSNQYPVIHIGGYNQTVSHVTWPAFIDGNPYYGIRQPSGCGMDATTRNLFVYRANLLLGKPYTVVNQIYYDLTSSSTYVYPSMITSIRCDGVVEYTYECMGIVLEALIIIGILQLTQLLILMRMQDLILRQKSNAIICLLTLQTAIQIDY